MSLSIVSNYAANVAHRNLAINDEAMTRSMAKLSSGSRVVSARDDAASMAIGSRLNAEVQALKVANSNASQAGSMLQIADGAMSTIDTALVRMKSLATQASSESLSAVERAYAFDEFGSIRDEIDRIANDTEFNGNKLLAGQTTLGIDAVDFAAAGAAVDLNSGAGFVGFEFASDAAGVSAADAFTVDVDGTNQIMTVTNTTTGMSQALDVSSYATLTGSQTADLQFDAFGLTMTINGNFDPTTDYGAANGEAATLNVTAGVANTSLTFKIGTGDVAAEDDLTFNLQNVTVNALGLNAITNFNTSGDASAAIATVSTAIDTLQDARSAVGVSQNRLEFATQNIRSSMENNEAARSTLLDVDVASEMANFTARQMQVQASVAMLGQAKQMPQNLLQLLR